MTYFTSVPNNGILWFALSFGSIDFFLKFVLVNEKPIVVTLQPFTLHYYIQTSAHWWDRVTKLSYEFQTSTHISYWMMQRCMSSKYSNLFFPWQPSESGLHISDIDKIFRSERNIIVSLKILQICLSVLDLRKKRNKTKIKQKPSNILRKYFLSLEKNYKFN